MDRLGHDFPHTWGDSVSGALIDWSGCLAVVVCLEPNCGLPQHGPYLSIEEAKTGAKEHRPKYHPSALIQGGAVVITPEAKAAAQRTLCVDCNTNKATRKWLCPNCTRKRRHQWLDTQNLLDPGETVEHYMKRYRNGDHA